MEYGPEDDDSASLLNAIISNTPITSHIHKLAARKAYSKIIAKSGNHKLLTILQPLIVIRIYGIPVAASRKTKSKSRVPKVDDKFSNLLFPQTFDNPD